MRRRDVSLTIAISVSLLGHGLVVAWGIHAYTQGQLAALLRLGQWTYASDLSQQRINLPSSSLLAPLAPPPETASPIPTDRISEPPPVTPPQTPPPPPPAPTPDPVARPAIGDDIGGGDAAHRSPGEAPQRARQSNQTQADLGLNPQGAQSSGQGGSGPASGNPAPPSPPSSPPTPSVPQPSPPTPAQAAKPPDTPLDALTEANRARDSQGFLKEGSTPRETPAPPAPSPAATPMVGVQPDRITPPVTPPRQPPRIPPTPNPLTEPTPQALPDARPDPKQNDVPPTDRPPTPRPDSPAKPAPESPTDDRPVGQTDQPRQSPGAPSANDAGTPKPPEQGPQSPTSGNTATPGTPLQQDPSRLPPPPPPPERTSPPAPPPTPRSDAPALDSPDSPTTRPTEAAKPTPRPDPSESGPEAAPAAPRVSPSEQTSSPPRPAQPPPQPASPGNSPGTGNTGDGRAPGPPAPPGDDSFQSDLESDPFSKIGSITFARGKVDARSGRKVRWVRPRLTLTGQIDASLSATTSLTLAVSIDNTGRVTKVDVLRSSGSPDTIDLPVVRAVYQWWIEPLTNAKGEPQPDTMVWRIDLQ